MQMDIQSHGFTLTHGLNDYVAKRLAYGLNHGDDAITRVTVRLSDINGPRGGADKRCFIEIRLKRATPVVIEDVEADLYVAIDRAAERASRTVARRLARQREFTPGLHAQGEDADLNLYTDSLEEK
ncbi:MAG: HPF/RaiA family ribosome-associated protein [Pseudomonadota bacterium]